MRNDEAKALAGLGTIGVIAVVGLFAFFGGFFTVNQTERAVVTRFGQFQYVAGPGLNFKVPFIDTYRVFNVAMQQVAVEDAETFTIDNQMIKVDMVIQYEIPDENVERVFREVPDFAGRLRSMAIDRMKQAFGRRQISDVPQQRAAIAQEILERVRSEAERLYGLRVIDIQLTDLEYTPAFRAELDQAAVAKARVERAEQERRQAEVVAQTAQIQARAQAQAAIEQARGEADRRLQIARAEAESIRLRGEAEAASIRAQTSALSESPNYVQLRQAERWNGALPTQILGTAPIPFMPFNQR
jgi:regulator of protease activity HflC (stomatin/prohibitin superfamily)